MLLTRQTWIGLRHNDDKHNRSVTTMSITIRKMNFKPSKQKKGKGIHALHNQEPRDACENRGECGAIGNQRVCFEWICPVASRIACSHHSNGTFALIALHVVWLYSHSILQPHGSRPRILCCGKSCIMLCRILNYAILCRTLCSTKEREAVIFISKMVRIYTVAQRDCYFPFVHIYISQVTSLAETDFIENCNARAVNQHTVGVWKVKSTMQQLMLGRTSMETLASTYLTWQKSTSRKTDTRKELTGTILD